MDEALENVLREQRMRVRMAMNVATFSSILFWLGAILLVVEASQGRIPGTFWLGITLLSLFYSRKLNPVFRLFSGPKIDGLYRVHEISVRPIDSLERCPELPPFLVRNAPQGEISNDKYVALQELVADSRYRDVKTHVQQLMEKSGRISNLDLARIVFYVEGKSAWLQSQMAQRHAEDAKNYLTGVIVESAPRASLTAESLKDTVTNSNNKQMDERPGKGLRKIIIETKSDGVT